MIEILGNGKYKKNNLKGKFHGFSSIWKNI